jgi:pentatricopeptide repeat protein
MMSMAIHDIYQYVVSIWVELFFVACFAVWFAVSRKGSSKSAKSQGKFSKDFARVRTEAAAGNASAAINAWRAAQKQQPTPCDTLKLVVQAFLDSEPLSLVKELVDHFALHAATICGPKAAVAALETVALAGNCAVMEDLFRSLTRQLRIPANMQLQEILLGGYAAAGNEGQATKLVAQFRGSKQKITVRAYSMMVRGFLKSGKLDAALSQVREMHTQGLKVPTFAVAEVFRIAREHGRSQEVFPIISNMDVSITAEAVGVVLEDCLSTGNLALAKEVERVARQHKVQFYFASYEAILKLHTSAGDVYAIELFDEVRRVFAFVNEGFCVSLISRSAEPKFLRMAEHVVTYMRENGKMSIITYSALMKVYSYCNMYSEACDLYQEIKDAKLEPDSTMYGCLMKFSAACGRTDLTRELSTKVGGLDMHHYMSLIRAAGQDKDVDRAFAILGELKGTGQHIDTVVYNAILDVCSSAGEMGRARELSTQMKKENLADIISYNTVLKGHCMRGDAKSAQQTVADMEDAGFHPNDVSYNCLINLTASAGDFSAAWNTIETMERRGIRVDQYTVSTMMKALKKAHTGKDTISRLFALLDRHGIDVCCEEVLLNTALEACMKHGEIRHLNTIVKSMKQARSRKQISQHTYANLIKASGSLKRIEHCWDLWGEMTEVHGFVPNGVALGCMLDALVVNGNVMEGVALLRKWQDRVPVSTVLYSTLIKGFTGIRDTQGAAAMWRELRTKDLPMNTIVYNAILDAHARVGGTKEVSALLQTMEEDGVSQDDITRSIVVKGFCMTGELDKAMEVFTANLPKQRAGTNAVIVYNTILDGCCRHNRTELADMLLAHMEEYHVVPSNYTLGIIVKLWGRRRNLALALDAVKTLPKKFGFTPNVPVKTSLMFACFRNDAIDIAIEVFGELRSAGHHGDAKLFSALINNCTRAGKIDQAVSFVEEAYGLSPGSKRVLALSEDLESSCMDQLLKSMSKQINFQEMGASLIKKLRDANVQTSSLHIRF